MGRIFLTATMCMAAISLLVAIRLVFDKYGSYDQPVPSHVLSSHMRYDHDAITRRIGNKSFKGLQLPGLTAGDFKAMCVQRQIVCSAWKMYGKRQYGSWPVCRASAFLPQQPCTVYSFGINYNWLFDDDYRKQHNCTIRTFDPSMGNTTEHMHKPGVPFYPLGISDRNELSDKGWKLNTYKAFLTRFNEQDKIISYLKFDIEHYEWQVLKNMLADGVLKNVKQLSFEMHVRRWNHVREYIELLRGLHDLGFRRWYYRVEHVGKNGNFIYQSDQSYLNINFLGNISSV